MRTINIVANQLPIDIAIQTYGNADAVVRLMETGPIRSFNDGITLKNGEADLAMPIAEGSTIIYDEGDILTDAVALKELDGATITSYIPRFQRLHVDTIRFTETVKALGGASTMTIAKVEILDRLVRDLHGEHNIDYATADIWDKFAAIYPFIFDHPDSHRTNLRDPRDTFDGFRLNYNGNPLHLASGMSLSGSDQYATTHIQAANHLNAADMMIGTVINGGTGAGGTNPVLIGASSSGTMGDNGMMLRAVTGGLSFQPSGIANRATSSTYTFGNGHYVGTCDGSHVRVYRGATELANVPYVPAAPIANEVYIGCCGGFHTTSAMNVRLTMAHFGQNLLPTELSCFRQAVAAYNTSLNR